MGTSAAAGSWPNITAAAHSNHTPTKYRGRGLEALRAFRPIVAAVARLHKSNVIHRDIKPANIFIGNGGDLVLGDFGIVFWADKKNQRLTQSLERVGTRDWMAPWANTGRRLAEVNPTFDVFPLGKLLWAMISGQTVLPYRWWKRPEYNLEKLFPDDPAMSWINTRLFAKTIVEHESGCVGNASDLHTMVNAIIDLLEHDGELLADGIERRCRVCGLGHYADFREGKPQVIAVINGRDVAQLRQVDLAYRNSDTAMTVRVQACDTCGHVELFHFADGTIPRAWRKIAE
jgi:serine/threonine protein kinase